MITSVRFCSSYDSLTLLHSERPKLYRVLVVLSAKGLEWGFTGFKMNIISVRKPIADKIAVNEVTCMHKNVITHVVICFYDSMLATA